MRYTRLVGLLSISLSTAVAAQRSGSRPLVIDVHMHAFPANAFGPPPVPACAGTVIFSPRDPRDSYSFPEFANCPAPLQSPANDRDARTRLIRVMERYNVIGMIDGGPEIIAKLQDAAPGRFIRQGTGPVDSVLRWGRDGSIRALAEFGVQYQGRSPTDSSIARYFAVAEELDLPVGIHMGLGPPGAPYGPGWDRYRARLGSPLLLEDVLVRHPKLRLWVMHAGWPLGDEMIALLYSHPQVYVDIGVISWAIPNAEFYRYLRRLVEAGFGKRIMFGSDQMIWPETVGLAIQAVEAAPFLTAEQKRDILFNNAVRFFRFEPARLSP